MSTKIGQFRVTQAPDINNYQEELIYQEDVISIKWGDKENIDTMEYKEYVISLPNDKDFEAGKTYCYKSTGTKLNTLLNSNSFIARLVSTIEGETVQMIIGEFSSASSIFTFTPNRNYKYLVFSTKSVNDKIIKAEEYGKLYLLENLCGTPQNSTALPLPKQLKRIGIQGAPGLKFSINGEDFIMGKSGIFMLNNIIVTKLNFFLKEIEPSTYKFYPDYIPYYSVDIGDDKIKNYEFFMIDYEY